MNRSRGRAAALAVVVVVVALLGVLWLGRPSSDKPLDPRSHRPGGTSALVALLRELGATVDLDAERLDSQVDVALVLRDELSDDQREDLEEWVRRGGTLVIFDPASPLTPMVLALGADPTGTEAVAAGICDFGPLDGLDEVEIYGGPADYVVEEGDESCFGSASRAYVVASSVGEGTIVAFGGSGIVMNRTLDEADNAPVAAAVLAPREGTRVALVDPNLPASEGDSLLDLISPGVKRALVQLALAFLVYVAWRARRLGKPVEEPQPVKVAGSELVSAVGGLLERSGSPQHAADVLRADLRRDLINQLGLPSDVSPQAFADIIAGHSQLDTARIQAALGPGPVTNDRELLDVVQLVDIVRKEVLANVGAR